MGLFDFFKRKPAAQPPSDLREALLSAAEQPDGGETLSRLCDTHRQEILNQFPTWRTVPVELRNDPIARDRYCQGLVAVASLFEQAGDPSLIALMIGDQATNPLAEWQRDLAAAQSLIDEGRPGQAVERLRATLDRMQALRGSGVDHYLPRTYGMLGVALYRAGNGHEAVEYMRKAKMLCEEFGDEEGVRVYDDNLRQMATDPT